MRSGIAETEIVLERVQGEVLVATGNRLAATTSARRPAAAPSTESAAIEVGDESIKLD